jgi:hypothetical protein
MPAGGLRDGGPGTPVKNGTGFEIFSLVFQKDIGFLTAGDDVYHPFFYSLNPV